MGKIKLSVVMPVHNTKEEYLRSAVESVLTQTFRDFEFIILNDGSSNNAQEVILSYKDSRIKYLKNEINLGLPKGRNLLLEEAKGEYIANMDSDDISLNTRFEKQIDFMDKNPEIGVLGCAFSIFQKREEDVFMPLQDEEMKKLLIKGIAPLANPSAIIRKSIIQDVRYDEKFGHCEDLIFWSDLANKTKFANLNEILLKYRWYGGNVSKKYTVDQSLGVQTLIYKNMEKYFGQNCTQELEIIEKLKKGKFISGREFKKLFEKNNIIEPNRTFKNIARKKCLNLFALLGGVK